LFGFVAADLTYIISHFAAHTHRQLSILLKEFELLVGHQAHLAGGATLTASGAVVGTPFFMSPEQAMGKPVSGASDQYSVAVMAYRMLSGQVPFEGDSAIDILHKHCMIAPPPLEVIQTGFPKHVYKAVHKALEKKAEDSDTPAEASEEKTAEAS